MFVPTLLTAILGDYKSSIPEARDPQVLALVTTTIKKMKDIMSNDIPGILTCVFQETLSMITKNFEDFPEHRIHFYSMIKSIIDFCFDSLFKISSEQFKLVVDSIVWAFKHTERNVSETGLETLLNFLSKVSKHEQLENQFYPVYYTSILHDIFVVLTDSLHKSGFNTQVEILQHLIHVSLVLRVPLSPNQTMPNPQYVSLYIYDMLSKAFTNKKPEEIQSYVEAMMKENSDLKTILRDLIITLKEFSGDNYELYHDVKEEERAKQEDFEQKKLIPGLLKPDDLPEDY